jgi:O-antigen/teichoic acid export membrane protein
MTLRKQIILNTGSNWASAAVTTVIGLVLIPIIIESVGVEAFC